MKTRRWIEPQDFIDMRRMADLKRYQVAALLDVTSPHHPELGDWRRAHSVDGLQAAAHPRRLRPAQLLRIYNYGQSN
jgi:hypothetical protein